MRRICTVGRAIVLSLCFSFKFRKAHKRWMVCVCASVCTCVHMDVCVCAFLPLLADLHLSLTRGFTLNFKFLQVTAGSHETDSSSRTLSLVMSSRASPTYDPRSYVTLRDIKDTKEESCRERTRGHRELKCGQRGWGATEGCVSPGLGSRWQSPCPHILRVLWSVTGKLGRGRRGGYKASRGGGTLKLLGCGFGEIFFLGVWAPGAFCLWDQRIFFPAHPLSS